MLSIPVLKKDLYLCLHVGKHKTYSFNGGLLVIYLDKNHLQQIQVQKSAGFWNQLSFKPTSISQRPTVLSTGTLALYAEQLYMRSNKLDINQHTSNLQYGKLKCYILIIHLLQTHNTNATCIYQFQPSIFMVLKHGTFQK